MLKPIEEYYNQIKNVEKRISKKEVESNPLHTHIFKKEYPRLPKIKIGKGKTQLDKLFQSRVSTRNFSKRIVSKKDFSKIIGSCRIIDRKRAPEQRTYPSAGARFPIEVYAIVYNVEGINKGVYHFNMNKNCLELLLKEDLRKKDSLILSPHIKNAGFAIILTSVLSRLEVKYGAKALSFSLLEAGHMAQNYTLVSETLNMGTCCVGGYIDEEIKKILDLVDNEIPVYVIAGGNKD